MSTIDPAWITEAERRYREVKNGQAFFGVREMLREWRIELDSGQKA